MQFNAFARGLLLSVTVAVCAVAPARAEDLTPEKRADIDKLFVMTGSLAIGKQVATTAAASMMLMLKKSRPDIPQRVLDIVPAEVGAVFEENMEALKTDLVPVYHQNFTHAEIRELIGFYSSEIGQKTIKVMPAMLQQSAIVSQRWAQALSPVIEQRVKAQLKKNGVQI